MPTIAKRLHDLIEPIHAIEVRDRVCRTIWIELSHKTHSNDTIALYRDLLLARAEIEKQLALLNINDGSREYYMEELEAFFSYTDIRRLDKKWEYDKRRIKFLLALDDQLSVGGFAEANIELDLETIKGDLQTLLSELRNSNIELSLKRYLMEAISGLAHSIERFELFGEAGLRQAYAATIGNLHAIELLENRDLPKDAQEPVSRFLKIVTTIGVSLQTSQAFLSLVKTGQEIGLLPSPE